MLACINYRKVSSLGLMMLMMSCASVQKPLEEKVKRVWPEAPAQPRIAYAYAFNNAEELGFIKGFWTRVVEFFIGSDDQVMIKPMAVTVSQDNTVFVADPGVYGVHRFDMNHADYDFIQLKDDVILPSPVGLVSDGQGNVLVSDSRLGKLFKISKGGDYATEFKLGYEIRQPTGLAINANESLLYIVDTASHEIIIHDYKTGQLVKRFGKHGNGNGEFNYPTMIWVAANGQLLVTDSLNFRIQRFDEQGKYLAQFGELGNATGTHSRPKGVATDNQGNIYTVDSLFHNVQIFNQDGTFLLNFGEQGQKPGQFWLPTGLFISQDRRIYVADSYNRRVQVFNIIGESL